MKQLILILCGNRCLSWTCLTWILLRWLAQERSDVDVTWNQKIIVHGYIFCTQPRRKKKILQTSSVQFVGMLAYSNSSALHFIGVSRPLHRVIYILGDADASILYHQRSLIRIHGNQRDIVALMFCFKGTVHPKIRDIYFSSYLWIIL